MTDLDRYDYELPRELIAQEPIPTRIDARLMVVRRAEGAVVHHHVRDLPSLLEPGDCLVLNDTRVIPARLDGCRARTGGHFEGLFLEADPHGLWRMMTRTRGKLSGGETITLLDADGREALALLLHAQQPDGTWVAEPRELDERENVAGDRSPAADTLALLERVGRVPLPPYIRDGRMVDADREQYQTVYARRPGAIAAPTAGLHFTKPLLERLAKRGVGVARLTLHVGPGTFRPITTERIEEHRLEAEWGEVTESTAEQINAVRAGPGRVVAVGTTSVRLLETAGADGTVRAFRGPTDLFIHPPYEFKIVDCLMTNFHLPRTTLLVLIRTFGGDELIRRAYDEAVAERYRFYSYGDSMLIL